MSQVKRLAHTPPAAVLPPVSPDTVRTFANGVYWPGMLSQGARVFRYGSSIPQLTGTRQQWLNVTEDAFDVAEDALQFCSLLDMTVADHGERDPRTGVPLPGAGSIEAWNTGGLRGELVVMSDLYVWEGTAAALAFDRVQGRAIGASAPGTPHLVTPGGASQILIRSVDVAKLRLEGAPRILPRVRVLH